MAKFSAQDLMASVLLWIIAFNSALAQNSPPTFISVDRTWTVMENTSVGTRISQMFATDAEGDSLVYSIDTNPSTSSIPASFAMDGSAYFRVDPQSGTVYLQEPLTGLKGRRLSLYVAAYDGFTVAKMQIIVQVTPPGESVFRPAAPLPSAIPAPVPGMTPPRLPGERELPPGFPPRPKDPPPGSVDRLDFDDPFAVPPIPPRTVISHSSVTPPPWPQNTPFVADDKPAETREPETQTSSSNVQTAQTPKESSSSPLITVVVPVVTVLGTSLILGVLFLLSRRHRAKKSISSSGSIDKEEAVKTNSNSSTPEDTISLQHWISKKAVSNRYESWHIGEVDQGWKNKNKTEDGWEFPRHRLRVIGILGEGCFGQVWKCEAVDIAGKEGTSIVAVKTLKESAGGKEREEILKELEVMKMLKPHPNIVSLLGCCTDKDPIFLIMEYVNGGKLQSFLRKSRAEHYYGNLHGSSSHLSSRDLTSFAYQVARAMDFLSTKGIIHRDLAARNVLIDEDRVCRVADFGFARDIIASHIYERKSEGRLPIRWMAPESLFDNIFTVKSDVWSYGVLLWEIVTLGSTPYPGLSAGQVMNKVRDGYRLEKPEHCKREIYNIMFYCWEKNPEQRPSFGDLVELLEQLLMSETDYIELEIFPDHSYYNMVPPSDEKV